MHLAKLKEREQRFKLALRMGLPIFALVIALVSNTLISKYENIETSFYIESILLLLFIIYFIFYLIYNGFNERVTDTITKTFIREYFYNYVQKKIKKGKECTFILISIDNLKDINARYGLKNGDKILTKTIEWICEYLDEKGLSKYPVGHIKGGDFIIALEGKKEKYNSILELMCIKVKDFKIDDIEVNIISAINDTQFTQDLDYLVESLFELSKENKSLKFSREEQNINPSEMDSVVIKAINEKTFTVLTQDVFDINNNVVIKECFVKLYNGEKIIHPKGFIKIINRVGLTLEYDLMVIQKVIKMLSSSENITLALSISPSSLRNYRFLTSLGTLLSLNSSRDAKIMFLLRENEYYYDIERYNTILHSLKKQGVIFGVDRLGAIETSFLYLRDLDIDVVRFDSFYTKGLHKKKYLNVIEGFHLMAQKKGVKTWMKLIESESDLQTIQGMGIDYLQGKALGTLK